MPSPQSLLNLQGIGRRYGGFDAVADVDLTVEQGARVAVIGPNGAGKSTLLGLIGGTVPPSSGRILLNGLDITKKGVRERARLGVVKTYQHSSVFNGMSVRENLEVSIRQRLGYGMRLFTRQHERTSLREEADHHVSMVALSHRSEALAGSLSHGERRALDLAIALAAKPNLLLLDEPMAGMTKGDSERMTALVNSLQADITVILVEHDMDVVFSLAKDVVAMAAGRVIDRGNPAHIQSSEAVQEVYLGSHERGEFFHV